jgi:DNA-binding response OmpR family regulator
MRIFLLEDENQLNKAITSVLKLKNYEVDSFYNGLEALKKIQENYDVYILDINVESINGLEILKKIVEYKKDSNVVMISASIDLETIKKAYNFGCADYIKKPFYLEELLFKISLFEIKTIFDIKLSKELTKKEKEFLELLKKTYPNIVTYETIDEVIFFKNSSKDAIRSLVKRVKQKLINYTIKSISKEGYKLEKYQNS